MKNIGQHTKASHGMVHQIVDAVYDAAFNSVQWQNTLGMIAEACRSKCCVLVVADQKTGANRFTHQFGLNNRFVHLHREKYGVLCPYTRPLQELPVGTVLAGASAIDKHSLWRSEYYQRWLKPQHLLDWMGFIALKTTHRVVRLGTLRHETQGHYKDVDVKLLSLFAPHVCRAIKISDTLNLKSIKSEALETTLDALAASVYLIDHEGRIAFMNQSAEQKLKAGNALRVVNNKLSAVDSTAHAALLAAITDAVANKSAASNGGITIAVPAGENAGLVATVLSLNRGGRQDLFGNFAAAVFVQDPIVVRHLPGEAFAKLYGLTRCELRVLLTMSPGLSVREAAEALGISAATAKTHLQHIFAKTGTSKQTELMHLFMSSAPPIQKTL